MALLLILALIAAPEASAEGSAGKKLGRGAVNVSLGVLALPGQIYQTTRESGPFIGLTWGLVKGVGWTVATETIGLWEILTCPFETPPDFQPILDPVYPWGHFQEASTAAKKSGPARRVRRPPREARSRSSID